MAQDTSREMTIFRQNQSQNARQLLVDKGWLPFVTTFEFMIYTQLWSDFVQQGITDDIKKRFKSFDDIVLERIEVERQRQDINSYSL